MSEPSNDDRADRLQHEIEEMREDIGELVGELDHRRHEAFNLGLQVRRHAFSLAIGGLAVLGLAAIGVSLMVSRSRKRRRLPTRAVRAGQSLVRMMARPWRQAPPTSNVQQRKQLASAGTAVVSALAIRLLRSHFSFSKPKRIRSST